MPEKGAGAAIGQNADMVKDVVEWVKDVASVPVLAKLTPNVTDIAAIANAAKEGGADGISAINTLLGFVGIDVDTLNPKLNVFGKTTFGGISGMAIKPIGLRCVAEIAKVGLPVSGIGGIADWRDAVEYMLIGTTTIQVCTAVMLKGFGVVDNLIDGLREFMQKNGYERVSDFVGLALDAIVSFSELDATRRNFASILVEKCSKCYSCITACSDSGFNAISIVDEYPAVDESRCDGCGLCTCVCPQECIEMKEVV
jgi:dihydropyrimidine dehydrogenase (NAD+) subunit PreA